MFTRRKNLDKVRHYSREFFQTLLVDLDKAGFAQSTVKLPFNQTGVAESTISPEELLRRERNYSALILQAKNPETNETFKVLFVNRDSKATFVDDTFPSGESEAPALYVESPDPARTYAVFEFFYDYLKRPSVAAVRLLLISNIVTWLFLIVECVTIVKTQSGVIGNQWNVSVLWDAFAILLLGFLSFRSYSIRTGLWIKPKRDVRLLQLANMAIRGELRDNPLVHLIITIVGSVVAALVLKLFDVL